MNAPPLCVDLDGTLIRSDSLCESLLDFLRRRPLNLLRLPFWLLRGRAHLKQQVAACALPDPAILPYRTDLLDWLRQQQAGKRALVLCTAADRRIAEAVAQHLGIFSHVLASDGVCNLRGEAKRVELVRRYGEHGYDYIGNDASDLAVWRSARRAVVVGGEPLAAKAGALAELERVFPSVRSGASIWLRALRAHQWVKNLLVLVPLALAHRFDADTVSAALLAFVSFCLCASSVYLLNDLLDLDSDRRHPRKCRRPFASGELPLAGGLCAAAVLLTAAFTVATTLPDRFINVLGAYYLTTLAYSLRLKRVTTLDVMLLAGLYTLRLIAGAAATGVALSFWLLAFSMFVFLSLGIVKRHTELALLRDAPARGRGYSADDLPMLRALGVSAGYGSVLVLALYINSPQSQTLYDHPAHLWLLCPLLLYWISRVWMKTHRGQMHDDPVAFALRDGVSLLIVVLMIAVAVSAA